MCLRTFATALLPLPVAVGIAFYWLPMPSLVEVGRTRIRMSASDDGFNDALHSASSGARGGARSLLSPRR